MRRFIIAALLAAALPVGACAQTAPDSATISNSGSTNTAAFTISVASDGNSSVTMTSRAGAPQGGPRSFTVPADLSQKFFADLAAAKNANYAPVPCMKSASFGTTTRVTWQGWTSFDVSCPPAGDAARALVDDVNKIVGIAQPAVRP